MFGAVVRMPRIGVGDGLEQVKSRGSAPAMAEYPPHVTAARHRAGISTRHETQCVTRIAVKSDTEKVPGEVGERHRLVSIARAGCGIKGFDCPAHRHFLLRGSDEAGVTSPIGALQRTSKPSP